MEKIDFIGVGVGRAGTTWVSGLLHQHSDILFSSQKTYKELYFFNQLKLRKYEPDLDSRYHLGLNWYLDQFPNYQPNKPRGEFCPGYFYCPKAYQRIKENFPNTKIIVCLRNPMDRLYSIFWYCKAAVVVKMPDRFERMVNDKEFLNSVEYFPHLKKYFDSFRREKIKVIIFNQIVKNPEGTAKSVFRFLGVSDNFIPDFNQLKTNSSVKTRCNRIKNIGRKTFNFFNRLGAEKPLKLIYYNKKLFRLYRKLNTRSFKKPPMKKETRQKLLNFFREDIIKTQELIEQNLSHWLK